MNGRGNVPAALANGLAGEVVRTFGEVRLRVFGTSMAPSILPGDLISIRRAGLREISPGEIVLFSQKGRLFVHRVVRSAERLDHVCLITRGDRLCHNDPPVSSSEFLGRVISVERGNRRIESIAQPSGRKRVIVRLLQTSDYATYAYVRLAALWGKIPFEPFIEQRSIDCHSERSEESLRRLFSVTPTGQRDSSSLRSSE